MGMMVVSGGQCACGFGTNPLPVQVTSQQKCLADGKPIATIKDSQVSSFGMCSSLANPSVAAATAAALGVLTPQPCKPQTAGTWMAGGTVMVDGTPVLTNDATLMCVMGAGTISITNPGQTKVMT